MENKKLNEKEMEKVTGGDAIITSTEMKEDGICPKCNGTAYRVTEKGYLGPFEIEKTYRKCLVHGWISV